MPSWPETLPRLILHSGLSNGLPDAVLRTDMDTGPAKTRRRFTAAVEPIKGALRLKREQTNILDTFYRSTLKMGALPFDWFHPRTQQPVEMRFVSPPRYQPSGAFWMADLDLEVMP